MTDVATNPTTGRTNPTLARRGLRTALERLADKHQLSPAEIAARTGTPVPTVRRWLKFDNLDMKPHQVTALLSAYGYSAEHDITQEYVRLAQAAKQRGLTQPRAPWMDRYEFNTFINFEQGASRIIDVEASIVPGLLQTAAYAEAVIRDNELGTIDDEDVAQRVTVRLGRQEVLRAEDPLQLTAIIDETALRRGPSDPEVMREQLEHLRTVAERAPVDGDEDQPRWSNVDLLIVPFSAGFSVTGETGSFVLMEFDQEYLEPIAYSEVPPSGVWVEGPGIVNYRAVIDHLSVRAVRGTAAVGMITEALRAWGLHR